MDKQLTNKLKKVPQKIKVRTIGSLEQNKKKASVKDIELTFV